MSTIAYSTDSKASGAFSPARELNTNTRIKYAGEVFTILEVARWGDREIVLTCKTAEMRAVIYLGRNEKVQVLN